MTNQILVGDKDATFNQVVSEMFEAPGIANLCNDWTHFAMKLDHPYLEVTQMRKALTWDQKSYTEIFLELLTKWRNREKSKATLEKLCDSLQKLEINDISDRLLTRFVPDSKKVNHGDDSVVDQTKIEPAVAVHKNEYSIRQINYTKEITPKNLFNRVCLHLYTKVLSSDTKILMAAIAGESSIQLGLEQLDSVNDDCIPVKQRWNNLKGLVESRQSLYPDSYEKFLSVLVNMDHHDFKSFSEGLYYNYIENMINENARQSGLN